MEDFEAGCHTRSCPENNKETKLGNKHNRFKIGEVKVLKLLTVLSIVDCT